MRVGKPEYLHLLAQSCDVTAFFDNSLAAVVVLVELVAEVLEDGNDGGTLWFCFRHGDIARSVDFWMKLKRLSFPGTFSTH